MTNYLEVKNRRKIKAVDDFLLRHLISLCDKWKYLPEDHSDGENNILEEKYSSVCGLLVKTWEYKPAFFLWLQSILESDATSSFKFISVRDLGAGWKNQPEVLSWLKKLAKSSDSNIQKAAILGLTYPSSDENDRELYNLLKEIYKQNITPSSQAAIFGLFHTWGKLPETKLILEECLVHKDPFMRWPAVEALAMYWQENPETIEILKKFSKDENDMVRREAYKALQTNQSWLRSSEVIEILFKAAINDPCERPTVSWGENPRLIALQSIIAHYLNHPQALGIIRDRATNDPDKKLRQWAQEQLETLNSSKE